MATNAMTRQEATYATLREDILSGRLRPGEKLPFEHLCSAYRVSVGVVREVLSRLVEQDLVVSVPQQGYSVKSISLLDLEDLTVARREIETLALRYAIAHGDVIWESEVLAAHHRLSATPSRDPDNPTRLTEAWVNAHREFHEALLDGCGNTRLTGIAKQWRASAELYRQWSVKAEQSRSRDITAEHQAITSAVIARDMEKAVALLDEHIALTTELLITSGVANN